MMPVGNTLIVVTRDGNVFGANVSGRDVGPVFQVHLPVPIIDLRANPNNLQINPELLITAHGFTPNGRFRYTVHNWPKVQDIQN